MNNQLLEHVHHFIETENLIAAGETIVIGLSGGPDSVFLFHVLNHLKHKLGCTLIAAHLDHQWRNDSANDALFCQELAQRAGTHFILEQAQNMPFLPKKNGSQEELGRLLRRHFFFTVAHRHGAQKIALGHHQDDQIETFFIRLMRGSSVTGLSGMKAHDNNYIRPLLNITKKDIVHYLEQHGLPYRIDSTNEHNAYLRNRLRHHALPALCAVDQRFTASCLKTMDNLAEADDFLEKHALEILHSISAHTDSSAALHKDSFSALHPAIKKRVTIAWLCLNNIPFTPSESFFAELFRFIDKQGSATHRINPSWSVGRKKNIITLAKH